MNTFNNEYEEINLSELFAYILRKFFIFLVVAIVGFIFGIGLNYFVTNSEKAVEEYEKKVTEYYNNLQYKENDLTVLKNQLELQNKINSESPIMQYDSQNVGKTSISFSIPFEEEDIIQLQSGTSTTLTTALTEKFKNYWNTVNIKDILGIDVKEEYLRYLISFSGKLNVFTVTVNAKTTDESEKRAETIYNYLCDSYRKGLISTSNSEEIIETSRRTENVISTSIDNYIKDNLNKSSELNTKIQESEEALEKYEKEEPAKYQFLKYGVIGAFLFVIVLCVVYFITFISVSPSTSSYISEEKLGVPFLGAQFVENSFWIKASRMVLGERSWKTPEEADRYLNNGLLLNIPEKSKIAVLSSSNIKAVDEGFKEVVKAISIGGYNLSFVTEAHQNPDTSDIISGSDYVVLLQKQWETSQKQTRVVIDLAEKLGKEVKGFILC